MCHPREATHLGIGRGLLWTDWAGVGFEPRTAYLQSAIPSNWLKLFLQIFMSIDVFSFLFHCLIRNIKLLTGQSVGQKCTGRAQKNDLKWSIFALIVLHRKNSIYILNRKSLCIFKKNSQRPRYRLAHIRYWYVGLPVSIWPYDWRTGIVNLQRPPHEKK